MNYLERRTQDQCQDFYQFYRYYSIGKLFKRCTQRVYSTDFSTDFKIQEVLVNEGIPTGCGAASLLLVHLDDVVLLHLQGLRGLVVVDPAAVKQEPEGCNGDANPLAVGLLELAHLCCLLHPEVDFVAVLS